MPDIGGFIWQSWRSAKIAIAAPSTHGDFRRSRRLAYKIARCVAGLKLPKLKRLLVRDALLTDLFVKILRRAHYGTESILFF